MIKNNRVDVKFQILYSYSFYIKPKKKKKKKKERRIERDTFSMEL